MKIKLYYIDNDSCDRPVYKDDIGRLLVDTEPRKSYEPKLCTKLNNAFEGEPDTPVSYLKDYKNAEFEFVPNRVTW